MPTKSFIVPSTKFTEYLAALPAQGFTVNAVDSDNGQVTGKGVTLTYNYNPASNNLALIGVDKPWIVSWDYIWGLLAEHLT